MSQNKLHQIFQTPKVVEKEEIAQYLSGKLNAERRFELENQMLDDPLLTDAVEGFKGSNVNLKKKLPIEDFNSFFQKLGVEEESGAKIHQLQPRKRSFQYWAAAAAVVILLAAGWQFLFNTTPSFTNEELFAQHFSSYDMQTQGFRGNPSSYNLVDLPIPLQRAIDFYEGKNFKESFAAFESYLSINSENYFAQFHKGMAALEINEVENAVTSLTKVWEHKGDYHTQAGWYLALLKIKDGDRDGAKNILKSIAKDENASFYKEAKTLLDQL